MQDTAHARAMAQRCLIQAAQERDADLARLLMSAARTWLLVVSVAEGRAVTAGDVITVEQLLGRVTGLQQEFSSQ